MSYAAFHTLHFLLGPLHSSLFCHSIHHVMVLVSLEQVRSGWDLITYLRGYGLNTMHTGQPNPMVELEYRGAEGFEKYRNKP